MQPHTIPLSRRMRATRRRENLTGYLFMAPALLFFFGFVVFPMVMCLVNSTFNYTLSDFTFIGLDNYARLLRDPKFGVSLINTLIIVLVSVPFTCFFSLWVASLIYKMRNLYTSFFRCVFYLPVVTGSVAVTVVWKWMFNPYYGLLNYVLRALGVIGQNVNWLGSTDTALGCIILILLTTSVGQPIVLYVAALSNVDQSLVEAAQVDGATNLETFWRIQWPQIMPTTLYILIITTINSFQCFALIDLLTSGGPKDSTLTIMYYIYHNAIKLNNFGYGCAMGVILAAIIALFSALQFRLAKYN